MAPQDAALVEDGRSVFRVVIDRSRGGPPLGINVDYADGMTVYIDAVKKGLFQQWNDKHVDQQVFAGDRIIEVNGVRGNALEMATAIKDSQNKKLDILIRKDESVFKVILDRVRGGELGVQVDYTDGQTVHIDSVGAGLFDFWNHASQDRQVQAGDRIIEVNGVSGSARQIAAELKKNKVLSILVRKPRVADNEEEELPAGTAEEPADDSPMAEDNLTPKNWLGPEGPTPSDDNVEPDSKTSWLEPETAKAKRVKDKTSNKIPVKSVSATSAWLTVS